MSPRSRASTKRGWLWLPIILGSLVLGVDAVLALLLAGPASPSPAVDDAAIAVPRTALIADLPGISADDAITTGVATSPDPAVVEPLPPIDGLPKAVELPGKTVVATAVIEVGTVDIWATPDGGTESAWQLQAPTEFGGPRHFLVTGETDEWLEIQVPVRPNGTVGWIPRAAVRVTTIDQRVQIDLSERSVIVWDGDDIVLDTTGAVGAEASPTPEGSFYVRDVFPWDEESIYGPWVLALSAYSESIDRINGGEAVIAIHGTKDTDAIGDAVSLGCIRLDDETVTKLAAIVGPGTPVDVVP